jgi:hypothetical protein
MMHFVWQDSRNHVILRFTVGSSNKEVKVASVEGL